MKRSLSPLVVFSWVVGLLATALLAAAILSPPVFFALGKFPIHRIFNRIAMLVFLVGTVVLIRVLAVGNRNTLGFGSPAGQQLKAALGGWVLGVLLLTLVAAILLLLGVRTWEPGTHGTIEAILLALPIALFTGLAVALIEETFFRGAMYGAIRQHGTVFSAVILSSILYSSVHFLGERVRIPAESVTWGSGFVVLGKYFGAYAQPLAIIDAFIALTLVGALLAIVRERTGGLGMSIGLHAGFVTVIAVLRKLSVPAPDQTWSFLVGRLDGVVGWLVAAMAACAVLVAITWPSRNRDDEHTRHDQRRAE